MIFDLELTNIIKKINCVWLFSYKKDFNDLDFIHANDAYKAIVVLECTIECDKEINLVTSIVNLSDEEVKSCSFKRGKYFTFENVYKNLLDIDSDERYTRYKAYIYSKDVVEVKIRKKIKYIPNYQILYNVGRSI